VLEFAKILSYSKTSSAQTFARTRLGGREDQLAHELDVIPMVNFTNIPMQRLSIDLNLYQV
jgi:hypothetical protein